MVLVCAIWGFQQVAIKAVAADISPVFQICLRSGAAALIVGAVMLAKRETPTGGTWKPGLLVGFLFAVEFLLVGEALRYTTASHSVMFLYTAPIFAALGLHWKLHSERLNTIQWLGVAVAMAGIVATFAGRAAGPASNMMLGDLLALLGGATWGATTLAVRTTSLTKAPATQTLFYQLAGAFVVLFIAAIALGQTGFKPTPLAVGSLLFQTVVVCSASFLLWFIMLLRYLASQLGVLTFMTPLFGIVFGVLFLHDPLETSFVAGSVLVVVGILMVTGFKGKSPTIQG